MSGVREFEGESLDEALEAASAELGIPVDDLQYEMIDEGRKGVFGLGARSVRVRVELEAARMPPALRAEELMPAAAPPPPSGRAGRPRPKPKPKPRSRQRSRSRSRGSSWDDAPERREAEPPEREDREETANERAVRETLERMLDLMGLQLRARVTASSSNHVRVRLGGRDRRALLHKDGQLLSALNLLLNRMSRRAWPEVGRIQVQCDGQRGGHRDEELVELVKEVASQVSNTGEPKELHPMNPYERRLAHIAVREHEDLTSHSVGDAFLKKIIIEKK